MRVSVRDSLDLYENIRKSHSNAFGINLPKSRLDEVIAKCNEMMPVTDLRTVYKVAWEIPADELKVRWIEEIAENYAIWGNTVPEPKFAITGIKINSAQIQKNGTNVYFTYNGIPYVKKYAGEGTYSKMVLKEPDEFTLTEKDLEIDVIGKFALSKNGDKLVAEVQIEDFYSREVENKEPVKIEEDFEVIKTEEVEDFEKVKTKITDDFDDFDF